MSAPVQVHLFAAAALPASVDALTPAERAALDPAFGSARRAEWIRGRVAARRSLRRGLGAAADQAAVLADPDGAPRAVGPGSVPLPLALSLSHDGDWVAVAWRRGPAPVAVDLCAREHERRLPRILARVGARVGTRIGPGTAELDPCLAWAAVECALKLRRASVASLLEGQASVRRLAPGLLEVEGLGPPVRCRGTSTDAWALAWACAAAAPEAAWAT